MLTFIKIIHKNIREVKLGLLLLQCEHDVRQQVVPHNMHKSILLKRDITNLYDSVCVEAD